ncbi:MAG: single-stranded-DNA-specific exonuclease RecJ [Anaerolineaceae bacterium]|nr:single-stranded-DNA-specific exonuclease RecJ [Anaerolineaceae bacterium]
MVDQSKTRWIIPTTISDEFQKALEPYPNLFRQILYNRGITTALMAESFLRADKPNHDPFLLRDFEKAIEMIHNSIVDNKKIIIFGDYDVDGITASALMVQVLQQYGAEVSSFIPNRFSEGYGLSMAALQKVLLLNPDLIITVDCGVRSQREVDYARDEGVDVIITDHHQPFESIPKANAVICPKQSGDAYPFKELAGVGIAYKVAQGLLEKYPIPYVDVENWIDLVAVGTIADLAPLNDENRTLVRKGLRSIRFGKRPGLLALANVSGINIHEIKADDIGFRIGPRLNAAGRLGSADLAFQVLMAETTEQAAPKALQLDQENQKRQGITKQIQTLVEKRYDPERDKWMLFYWDEKFNEGVVGLAASRLAEQYYRPTIIGTRNGKTVHASCRSIPELNITSALDECKDLLLNHGGHAMAAGLSIEMKNIDAFAKKFTGICSRELDRDFPLVRKIKADARVNLVDLRPDLLKNFDGLEPVGIGNPMPLFVAEGVECKNIRRIGKTGDHLKMTVTDGKINFDAIAFRLGDFEETIKTAQKISILFSYELNKFNGNERLQLNIKDIKLNEVKNQ